MSAAASLPIDVRLMNWVAAVLLLGCMAAFVLALGHWAARLPLFALTHVSVDGELSHVNVQVLQAEVAPSLTGNFFTVDLQAVRKAFEQVPWIQSVQVQREFPHTLHVRVRQQQAAAYWGEAGGETLVNREGEVFQADVGSLEDEHLVRLEGPAGASARMLAMFHRLAPALQPLGLPLESLRLSAHGSWRAVLAGGATVELGQGEAPELLQRLQRLTGTLTQIAQRQGRRIDQLEYADLRYANGYALRLKGVTTLSGEAPAPARRAAPKNQRG